MTSWPSRARVTPLWMIAVEPSAISTANDSIATKTAPDPFPAAARATSHPFPVSTDWPTPGRREPPGEWSCRAYAPPLRTRKAFAESTFELLRQ